MRKIILILIAFLAIATFVRAFGSLEDTVKHVSVPSTGLLNTAP